MCKVRLKVLDRATTSRLRLEIPLQVWSPTLQHFQYPWITAPWHFGTVALRSLLQFTQLVAHESLLGLIRSEPIIPLGLRKLIRQEMMLPHGLVRLVRVRVICDRRQPGLTYIEALVLYNRH